MLRAARPGSLYTISGGNRVFCRLHTIQTGSGAHPAYPMSTGVHNPRAKRPGREGDHSFLSTTKLNNAWSYTSTLLMRLTGVVLHI
jgi:hypothetical protein